MSGTLSLNGTWGLAWAEGSMLMHPEYFTAPRVTGRKLLPARVPAPIHQVLQEAGILEDPNYGLNSLRARWVEEQYWTYRHTFDVPDEAATQPAWLVFEQLEMMATVWLNGEEIGEHANVHRPARFEVTGKLRPGENLLVVQLTSGMAEVCDKPIRDYHPDQIALLTKRMWLRKPQYQCGWDWNPRLQNVGILGDVRLEWSAAPKLIQATVLALPSADLTSATVYARATVLNPGAEAVEGVLRVRVVESGEEAQAAVTLQPGESRSEVQLEMAAPRLWWPRGQGEPALYTVEVTLEAAGETQTASRRLGVRRVEVDQSAHPVEGQYFIVKINNRPVFCRGGNWAPPDVYHSAVPRERYQALVDLAVEANFNVLRVWGGVTWAHPWLLEACDEAGVMVWHDLLFACAKYPGDDPDFAAEVRREVTWGVREMAHHPSLIVWCGNNEIEWGDWDWGYDDAGRTHPHYALFHHDLPQIVTREDPSKFYWISSPYSPDYQQPQRPHRRRPAPLDRLHGSRRGELVEVPRPGGPLPQRGRRHGRLPGGHLAPVPPRGRAGAALAQLGPSRQPLRRLRRQRSGWPRPRLRHRPTLAGPRPPGPVPRRLRLPQRPAAGRGPRRVRLQLPPPHVQQRLGDVLELQRLLAGE